MKRWEYWTVDVNSCDGYELSMAGKHGWELVTVINDLRFDGIITNGKDGYGNLGNAAC